MNKIICLIVILFTYQNVNAQLTSFESFFENDKDQHSAKIITMNENIYEINNYSIPSGSYNAVIRKLSSELDLEDTLYFSNENSSILINDIINYQGENIFIIGTKEDINNSGFYDIMVIKLDENLDIIDETYVNMNTGMLDFVYHYVKEDGTIVVASSINGSPPNTGVSYFDFLIMKINEDTEIIYDSIYDYSPTEIVMDLKPIPGTSNSLLLCSPNFEPGNFSKRINILDENFDVVEAQYIPDREYQMSINILDNQQLLITSRKFNQDYTPAAWLAQQRLIDDNYNELAVNVFGSPDTMMYPAEYNSIAYQDDLNIFTAYTYNFDLLTYSSKKSYVCLSSIDSELNHNWTKYYGGDAYYFVCDICPAANDGCIITGTKYKDNGINPFEREIFIMKVDQNGLITSTNQEPAIPIKNAIITPNPGNNYLQLHTGIFPATLQIFNTKGQMVLERKIQQNSTTIQTQTLAAGTYVWQLQKDGSIVEVGKWVKE